MCYFITIAIPYKNQEAIQDLPQGFSLMSVANPSIQALLPPDFTTFLIVSNGCSCDLYQRKLSSLDTDHLRLKYKKKGWSKTKIERAVKQSIASRPQNKNFIGIRNDVTSFLRSLRSKVETVGLHIHWYTEEVEKENVISGPSKSFDLDIAETVPDEDSVLWVNSCCGI